MRMSSAVAVVLVSMTACQGGTASSYAADAPSDPATPLQGVWRVTEATVTGANPSTMVDPPGIFIFARTHYSMMRATGGAERALFKSLNPADAEKIAAFNTFNANTGTYEVAGSTLTVRPIVAKSPNFMGGGHNTYQFRTSGDTLWLVGKNSNIQYRLGGALVSDTGPVEETTLKLVPVES